LAGPFSTLTSKKNKFFGSAATEKNQGIRRNCESGIS
jgi:hypothetical protein